MVKQQTPLDPLPEPGTYHRVLARKVIDVSSARPRLTTYATNVVARRTELPDGRRLHCVFLPIGSKHEASADWAVRTQKWEDVTEQFEHHDGDAQEGKLAERAATPKVTGPSESPIEHAVRNMRWRDLQKRAKELGVPAAGARADVEEFVIEALSDPDRDHGEE